MNIKNPPTIKQFGERLKLVIGLRHQGYFELAKYLGEDLLLASPEEPAVLHALGQVATESGRFADARDLHARAMNAIKQIGLRAGQEKDYQNACLALAQAQMRYGQFEQSWPLWEAGRLNVSWAPWPGSKYWNGHPNAPESILVQSEGGYGDTFMFSRWLPMLKRWAGAARVGLMAWKPLEGFCDWSKLGVDDFYVIGHDTVKFGEWEYATSIMSMPAVFHTLDYSQIPTVPKLVPKLFEYGYLSNTASLNFRLGFCWRAEENTSPIRTKSLPVEVASEVAHRITNSDWFRKEGLEILSLSPEKADLYNDSKFDQPAYLKLEPLKMQSWRDTAEYMCSMDFILTVDTAVAHLAGLLGIPCLVLLPKSSCWRWGLPDRKSGPWYGPQLTYYRQPIALDWNAEEIVNSLMERLNK